VEIEFGKSLLNGAIVTMPENNQFFLDIIKNIIGIILGAVISIIVTFNFSKAQKKYDIQIQVITEKILNPLFQKYYIIKMRKRDNYGVEISANLFEEIEEVFYKNTCWYFVLDKEIKPILINIRDAACNMEEKKLIEELEKLYNLIESIYVKKYS